MRKKMEMWKAKGVCYDGEECNGNSFFSMGDERVMRMRNGV